MRGNLYGHEFARANKMAEMESSKGGRINTHKKQHFVVLLLSIGSF